jgi:hypothetical protein
VEAKSTCDRAVRYLKPNSASLQRRLSRDLGFRELEISYKVEVPIPSRASRTSPSVLFATNTTTA